MIIQIKKPITQILIFAICHLAFSWCFAQELQIRSPAVSGIFYPADPQKLNQTVEDFLNGVPEIKIEGQLFGLIVPHAGYEYSGKVAAYAYRLLENQKFEKVIIIGPSHRTYFKGAVVYQGEAFRTPLGLVQIHKDLTNNLMSTTSLIRFENFPHKYEHSIEVQLPFLQYLWKGFSFVPLLITDASLENCKRVKEAIKPCIKKGKILIIASSDMSHYHDYRTAVEMDRKTLELIKDNKIEELARALSAGKVELCGAGPVMVVMLLAKELGIDKIEVLKYANSGDATGDFSRVVGYCAVSFSFKNLDKRGLDIRSKKRLLEIARQTLMGYLKNKKIPKLKILEPPVLLEKRGVFVTLRKGEKLRGCIGSFSTQLPLYLQVQKMAMAAAINDPRFLPVTEEELNELEIEISVLSPLKKISTLDELILGRHGIYVRYGAKSGCYLPQVADQTGWSKEEFLRRCFIDKAGLDPDTWRKGAEVFVFEAEVFSEEEFKK